jgi:hypothetical protein
LQAPAPDLPIEKGRPGPGLIAGVVVGKYLDGLPLYRQSAILAREGVEIERATLADWVGHVAWWVAPLAELIGAQVMAAPVIHTDDTPIAVLAPGNGKTRTGRLWAYVLDERPWQGGRTPAAYYRFSSDRKGDHLAGFRGVIQADAFAGYEALARSAASGRGPPRLIHAACRVGGGVAIPAPHRPGRADYPHPVLRAQASLTRRCTGGRSRLAAAGIVRAWPGSAATADCCDVRAERAIFSISARAGGGTS